MGKRVLVSGEPAIASVAAEKDVFRQLQAAIRAGVACEEFPIGTVIPDRWTDVRTGIEHLMPLIIVDYRGWQMANGEWRIGATLLRQQAIPWMSPHTFSRWGMRDYNNSILNIVSHRDYWRGCSEELKAVLASVVITGYYNEIALVKTFVPSLKDLHLDPYRQFGIDDVAWAYFRDTPTDCREPCDKRVFCDPWGIAQACWTRSVFYEYENSAWCIDSDGSARGYHAIGYYPYVLACVIASH